MGRNAHTKVLIVDNQPLYSIGLCALLDKHSKFNVIGTAVNFEEAVKLAEKGNPHLVIMEILPGKDDGMNLITKLKTMNPEISILILSIYDERFYSERVLRLGARGFVMKTSSSNIIMNAVSVVLEGKVFLSEQERDRIFQAMTEESSRGSKDWSVSLAKLSNREIQVFSLIGKGYGTIDIASKLNLSTKTIDTHKEHIKLKLHCSSSQELRQQAIEWSNHYQYLF